jgi:hypothetical protein
MCKEEEKRKFKKKKKTKQWWAQLALTWLSGCGLRKQKQ